MKARVFCSSHNRDLIEELKTALPPEVLQNDPGLLNAPGQDIGSFKRKSQGFIFVPEPVTRFSNPEVLEDFQRDVLLSLFFLNSLFTSIQIGDPNLSFKTVPDGPAYQKLLIIYDQHGTLEQENNPYRLFLDMLARMEAHGRMSQKVSDLITIARTPDELEAALDKRIDARQNVTKHTFDATEEEWRRMREELLANRYKAKPGFDLGILTDLRTGIKRGVAGFTSARPSNLLSQRECWRVAEGYAERNFATISGIGLTGHMGYLHIAAKQYNAPSLGWITAEVLDIECPPLDADFIGISDTIYERMYQISLHSRETIIGVGGMAGAGTSQEGLAELLLQIHGSNAVRFIKRNDDIALKPTFVDDRLGILEPFIKLADVLGLNQGHIRRCIGSDDILAASLEHEKDCARSFTPRTSFQQAVRLSPASILGK